MNKPTEVLFVSEILSVCVYPYIKEHEQRETIKHILGTAHDLAVKYDCEEYLAQCCIKFAKDGQF